ncbi:hypothetical protein CTX76_002566 [Salmonella enterica subsp. houtenae]|uniref:Uncharacterized protein n=4 Tax=Salmonella houtenae TaxID=59205 RepID=A0A736I4D3_SALHO|nr:hypothetical protein [Salmonella enterica]EDP9791675.1 hypothetical protein [Salmonella enterica subsp. salamae]EDQ1016785.1 hypothetical protein [Salmonella enterica subsp. houtenae serovar 50:z4,z23:-]EDQ1047852.1 hypothetical protein [Salmonella enterica subsp. houtenae]EDR4399913.1 hypothetical protein [Salmonella enterica subsp. houtenae serovar 44:z4,z23:-]EDR6668342.1 hypothetical protein [Salmonella enterica subsp. enterica]EDW0440596.1 hypothetical protein [Salmonella enterica sub
MGLKPAEKIRRDSANYIGARASGCKKAGYKAATYLFLEYHSHPTDFSTDV